MKYWRDHVLTLAAFAVITALLLAGGYGLSRLIFAGGPEPTPTTECQCQR